MLISSVQGAEVAPTISKTVAPSPKAEAEATGQSYYFSPALVIDPKSGTDVLEYRNSSTGVVTNQFPSEKDIKAYAQHSLKQDDVAPVATTQPAAPSQAAAASDAQKPTDDITAAAAANTAKPVATESVIV